MVEHAAVNRVVAGSSPASGAKSFHTKNLISPISSKSNRAGIFDFRFRIVNVDSPDERIQKCLLMHDAAVI